jgi:hypothetical protein
VRVKGVLVGKLTRICERVELSNKRGLILEVRLFQ